MAIFLYIVGGALIFIGVLFHLGLALAGVSTLVLGAIVGRVDRAAFARMIEQGADPKVRNDNGRPFLHRAVRNGRLDAGADSNTHDRFIASTLKRRLSERSKARTGASW